eukprot:CAMPEP_0119045056 /NCGR_PEP_ID=MMETSP1177-20130426/36632_1 /TAXON_ID=2985 /ORGANISM="Ochromonas sp, Strain CCMP1899" /LENGTH=785 /DNA_ID=CAMNT_0007016149 /DNA_START=1 /DNA_END=2358 /DNA_ORIENTATION=+
MKVASFNGCKVYNLATGKTMPQWLSETKKRQMTRDDDYRKRLELIQDFEMATASQTIKMTPDGEHIIVAGTYPPIVRCYTVSDMAMKFQRGLTCDVVTFETLSDDYGKLVFLQTDRTLNFHAPYGTHYSVRVPKFGRDLCYGWETCDLYVAGSGEEVYRLNLESGQFREPFTLGFTGCNKVHMNPTHQFLGCGGETAACEFWDPRSRKAIAKLQVDSDMNVEVTALKFDTDGLTLGVGTSNGNCLLYDIRSKTPLYVKEHQYGLPVIDISFHNSSKHVISTDKKVVKIWERDEPNMGKVLTNIEAPADINALHCVADRRGQSGLLMLAGEQSRMMLYFVPQLGPAPRWCSFLEGLTEELEETAGQNVYEDFKFVTKTEVEELGASGLIGTPMLKGYMHGFFMEMKLFNKLRAVSKPFEHEEHRKKKIQGKIDEKRQSRITAQKRLPKVNKDLAEKMIKLTASLKNKAGAGSAENSADAKKEGDENIIDSRFASLFKREEFERDEMSTEFRLRNPSKGNNQKRSGNDDSDDELQNLYSQVEEAEEPDSDDDEGYSDHSDDDEQYEKNGDHKGPDDDDSDIEQIRAEEEGKEKSKKRKGRKGDDSDEEGEISRATKRAVAKSEATALSQAKRSLSAMKGKIASSSDSKRNKADSSSSKGGPKMYEIADGVSTSRAVFSHTDEARGLRKADRAIGTVPLSDRVNINSSSSKNGQGDKTSGKKGKAGRREEGEGAESEAGKVRYIRTLEEGLVREMSFVPKEKGGDVLGAAAKKPKGEGKAKDKKAKDY